jgi:hypothetical protein
VCRIEKRSEQPLRVAGSKPFYVEGSGIGESDGDVLLLGSPLYLHDLSSGELRRESVDTLLGAVLVEDGSARAVRSPIPSRLATDIHVLGRGAGTWDVVFGEAAPRPENSDLAADTTVRVWHGVYDGSRWRSLAVVPFPEGTYPLTQASSELVRRGDTLFWATPVQVGARRAIAVLAFHDGRWTSELVGSWGYGYLGDGGADGLLLAVVQGDTTLMSDANSLFLYTRAPTWALVRKVAAGSAGLTGNPAFFLGPRGLFLAWEADIPGGRELRVLHDPLHAPLSQVQVVDSAYATWRPVRAIATRNGPIWIVDHFSEQTGMRQVRFVSGFDGVPREIARWPSPFWQGIAGFRATSLNPNEAMLSGPMMKDSLPVSLVVRVRATCR